MPSDLIINQQSVVGYNNSLKKVDKHMKFGVNSDVNKDLKSGKGVVFSRKVNSQTTKQIAPPDGKNKKLETMIKTNDSHESNKVLIYIAGAAVAFAAYKFI